MKRLAKISIFVAMFALILSLSVSAESDDNMALLPTEDFKQVYVLVDNHNNQLPIYGVRENLSQYTYVNEWLPTENVGLIEWIRGINTNQGTVSKYLFDGTLLTAVTTSNGFVTVTMTLINNVTGLTQSYTLFTNLASVEDIVFVVQNDGQLGYIRYNKNTGLVNGSGTIVYPFYGNVYIPNRIPDDGIYNEGFNDGYKAGESAGYDDGYADGLDNRTNQDAVYDIGYAEGYEGGYWVGYTQGMKSDNEAVFNAGVAKGQQDAKIIPAAIDGFFDSILGFMSPFLSIGFGGLTLYTLLGVMVVVAIVVLIIKITR